MGFLKSKEERGFARANKDLVKSTKRLLEQEGFPKNAGTDISVEVFSGRLTVHFLGNEGSTPLVEERKELKQLLAQAPTIIPEETPDWLVGNMLFGKHASGADMSIDIRVNGGANALKEKIDALAAERAAQRGEPTQHRDLLAHQESVIGRTR